MDEVTPPWIWLRFTIFSEFEAPGFSELDQRRQTFEMRDVTAEHNMPLVTTFCYADPGETGTE